MSNASELPKGAVRQGGKEELRGSLLKTYLLRIRAEKGERTVRTILATAGIDASMVDNETGWVSTQAARRALRGICEALGSVDSLRRRGEWVTNAEALGTHGSETDFDAAMAVLLKFADAVAHGSYTAILALNAISQLGDKAKPYKAAIEKLPLVDPQSPARVNREYTTRLVERLRQVL